MTPDKLIKSIEELYKDVESDEAFGLYVCTMSSYISSVVSGPNKNPVDDTIFSMYGMILESYTLLAKQNNRIQALQSSLAQLTIRINEMEELREE